MDVCTDSGDTICPPIENGEGITKQREITPKVRNAGLSFFNMTRCLVLFYISTKYHQNIPKGIQVTERTRSFTPMPTLTPKGSFP